MTDSKHDTSLPNGFHNSAATIGCNSHGLLEEKVVSPCGQGNGGLNMQGVLRVVVHNTMSPKTDGNGTANGRDKTNVTP